MIDTIPGFTRTDEGLTCDRCRTLYRYRMPFGAYGIDDEHVCTAPHEPNDGSGCPEPALSLGCAYCGPRAVGRVWVKRDEPLAKQNDAGSWTFPGWEQSVGEGCVPADSVVAISGRQSYSRGGTGCELVWGEHSAYSWPEDWFHVFYRPATKAEAAAREGGEREPQSISTRYDHLRVNSLDKSEDVESGAFSKMLATGYETEMARYKRPENTEPYCSSCRRCHSLYAGCPDVPPQPDKSEERLTTAGNLYNAISNAHRDMDPDEVIAILTEQIEVALVLKLPLRVDRHEYIRKALKERGPKVFGESEVLPEHWREW